MNEQTTRLFVSEWNKRNGFTNSENTPEGNMRYHAPGVVTWNEYDAPDFDLVQAEEILKIIK